ncbi:MAG: cobalt ECF transporter T component CbiQ [Peptostreptococcaceae bacterium]|nr:cobalt ECF transporter T component CbiQ [Peptostreptococcaceae bacterium]
MTMLSKATYGFHNLENIAEGETIIHRLNPLTKTITTFLYVVIVVSFDRYSISGLLPFVFYPVVFMSLGEIPLKPLLSRLAIALPFCIFAGVANIIFDQDTMLTLMGFNISFGLVSLVSITLKAGLTVMAVLILIATTKMPAISRQLIRLKVPTIFVLLISMIYRYISVALEETINMYIAYSLRSPHNKGIKIKDMGSFVGQLLLRSFDRGERVYFAMKCRGFSGDYKYVPTPKPPALELIYIISFAAAAIILRIVNVSDLIGGII